jgi:hypothetical protein
MKKISLAIIIALSLSIFLTWCNTNIKNTDSNLKINQKNTQTWDINIETEKNNGNKNTEQNTTDIETNKNNTRIYENKTNNFSFEFNDWREFQEDKYGFTVIVFTPTDDEIKENVGVTIQQLQKFISIQEYYEETVNKLTETLNNFKEISNYEVTNKNIDWLKWKTIIYQYQEPESKIIIKSQQTFFIWTENTVYIINYTATTDTFNNFTDWVNKIIDSFNIV